MQKIFRKLAHGLGWRWRKYRAAASSRMAHARIYTRWRVRTQGRAHSLPSRLIVSLTSYPPRFETLALSLKSLLRQTVRADQTILWISHADMPLLPKSVTDLESSGLTIRATEDMRSYKKILPALEMLPDAYICTADDDLYYRPTWLEELVEGTRLGERVIACHRAHEIVTDGDGLFRSYSEWRLDTPFRGQANCLFATSGGGVLYPPGAAAHSSADRAAISELCSSGDDIWLYWMTRVNGYTYRTVGQHRRLITLAGSQEEALWYQNLAGGFNDSMVRSMGRRYGYPNVDEGAPGGWSSDSTGGSGAGSRKFHQTV